MEDIEGGKVVEEGARIISVEKKEKNKRCTRVSHLDITDQGAVYVYVSESPSGN